jgi:hypothetical protein
MRRVPETAVPVIRSDYTLRRQAEQMQRLAADILRRTPSCVDHAERFGISPEGVRKIARGLAYKDVAGA